MIYATPMNIYRCGCSGRPKCEMYRGNCGNYADGFAIVPATWSHPIRFTSNFTCVACWEFFMKAWQTHIPGWDRPEWADDEWKPSVMACIDLARREMNEKLRRASRA